MKLDFAHWKGKQHVLSAITWLVWFFAAVIHFVSELNTTSWLDLRRHEEMRCAPLKVNNLES